MVANEFQLLTIQTHILKVQIHCDGCARKVKKLLKKIEGVYTVSIDIEKQKVNVSGTVESARLIRKLIKSGKHAELWSPADNQIQNVQGLPSWLLDGRSRTNGLDAFKTQPLMSPDSSMGESDSFGASTWGNSPQLGWREDIAPDALGMEGNMRSMAFPDYRNSVGGYTRFEEKGYPGLPLPQLLSSPAYGHFYAPLVMSKNNLQQYKYNFPSNMMMNHQNSPLTSTYEHYSPSPVITNNMQQYQYSLPSPLEMNTELSHMHASYRPRMFDNNYVHLPQGIMSPLFHPV